MKKRKPEEGEEVYLFKVTLSDWFGRVRGMPYRILAIPEGFTLYDFYLLLCFLLGNWKITEMWQEQK